MHENEGGPRKGRPEPPAAKPNARGDSSPGPDSGDIPAHRLSLAEADLRRRQHDLA
jgi:hypothetical protein